MAGTNQKLEFTRPQIAERFVMENDFAKLPFQSNYAPSNTQHIESIYAPKEKFGLSVCLALSP